jgi:hypothetical protein
LDTGKELAGGDPMNIATRGVACYCIFATLFMGCSGSMVIQPTVADNEKLYSHDIEYAIGKDSTVYVFDVPPDVVHDVIMGRATIRSTKGIERDTVSIPLSEVETVSLKKTNRPDAAVGLLIVALLFVALIAVVAGGGVMHWRSTTL